MTRRVAKDEFIERLSTIVASSVTEGNIVSQKLAHAIREGKFSLGDELPSEGDLAAAFGVSKEVAHVAIRDLAALGMVEVRWGQNARVGKLDVSPLERYLQVAVSGSALGLAKACEYRLILEPPIAGLAAIRHDERELVLLRKCLERMEQSFGDIESWTEADLDFHETVAILADNDMLHIQIQALRPIIREIMHQFNNRESRSMHEWDKTFRRHEAIYNGISLRDAETAASAMASHFEPASAALELLKNRSQSVGT